MMGARLNTALDAISAAMKYLDPAPRAAKELTGPAKRARAFLGVTEDPMESGYILPNGEFLDMSGVGRDISDFPSTARDIGSMSFDFAPGRRNLPHAVVNDIMDMRVPEFLDQSGAVRIDPTEVTMESTRIPTAVQRYRAADVAKDNFSSIFAEATDPETRAFLGSQQFNDPSPNQLKKFYDTTISRRGLTRPAQELLNVLDQMDQGIDPGSRLNTYLDQIPEGTDPLDLLLRKP